MLENVEKVEKCRKNLKKAEKYLKSWKMSEELKNGEKVEKW